MATTTPKKQRHKPEELEGLDQELVDLTCGITQTKLILCL